jgi:hypothetical protein
MAGTATNLNLSALLVADVPPAVVTVMFTVVPAMPAGSVAVVCMADTTVKLIAAVLRKVTRVAPVKLVPVIVT